MAIAREALRLLTVRALRADGRLQRWIGDRVRDSEHGPIEDPEREALRPELMVFTDDGKFGGGHRDLLAGGPVNLVIEIVITQRMQVRAEEGGDDGWVWEQPQTDAAMELSLGLIEDAVLLALTSPTSEWAELWRMFAMDIGECSSQRGTMMRDGVRFAGRQLTLPVMLPKRPPPGAAPGPLWAALLDKIDATADLAPIAAMLRETVLAGAPDWPGWQVTQGGYGMTAAETRALGIGPPAGVVGESNVAADGLTIEETETP